jgi:acetyltransferase-like isoleucine patch superfamily enzyme
MNKQKLRNLVKSLAIRSRPAMKFFLSLFFDREYLNGRHFDESFTGYIWGIQAIWQRNILRLAAPLPFPAGITTSISNASHITFHTDDLNNLQSPGTYFQNFSGHISIGRGCYIAPNVGIITSNHDTLNLDKHLNARNVSIGENSWIGMNAVILPGVTLGPRTIVGACAVITKSFPAGNCVLAGNPAKIIRELPER